MTSAVYHDLIDLDRPKGGPGDTDQFSVFADAPSEYLEYPG
ncbi:MAG: hypothetical protein U9Q05_04995 [Thermodesulfobacteriota bacterium]|nr:hypothetical protein [Thermodesulfobacteriota bacterium]